MPSRLTNSLKKKRGRVYLTIGGFGGVLLTISFQLIFKPESSATWKSIFIATLAFLELVMQQCGATVFICLIALMINSATFVFIFIKLLNHFQSELDRVAEERNRYQDHFLGGGRKTTK
jgi:hypothetical protein